MRESSIVGSGLGSGWWTADIIHFGVPHGHILIDDIIIVQLLYRLPDFRQTEF